MGLVRELASVRAGTSWECGDECEMIAEYQDNPEMLARLEVIGNIHENPDLLEE